MVVSIRPQLNIAYTFLFNSSTVLRMLTKLVANQLRLRPHWRLIGKWIFFQWIHEYDTALYVYTVFNFVWQRCKLAAKKSPRRHDSFEPQKWEMEITKKKTTELCKTAARDLQVAANKVWPSHLWRALALWLQERRNERRLREATSQSDLTLLT